MHSAPGNYRQFVPAALLGAFVISGAVMGLRGCGHAPAKSLLPLAVATPIVRHAPWSPGEITAVQSLLDANFGSLTQSTHNGFVMIAADGTKLYDRHGSSPVAPASTLKVLTAASALQTLGANYRFSTRVAALDPIQNGILDGDLYVIGGGDPVLTSADLRGAVIELKRQGLTTVQGRVVADGTAFTGPEQNPHWAPDDLNLDYATGTSALSLDEGVQIFAVQPSVSGSHAIIRLEPANDEATLLGTITTGGGNDVHIDHVAGANRYLLHGTVAPGIEQRFPIPVGNLVAQVGGVFNVMLKKRDITVSGPSRIDAAPFGATTLWSHRSAPLADLVHHMLVTSNNHVAEQLLRTIAASSGHKGAEPQGVAVELAYLAKLGVVDPKTRIYDGSGLSPGNRIAARSLATVVADAARTPKHPLVIGMPRVGIEGTVRGHVLHAALGRVRAKSGHISGVDGLVGVVQTPKHGPIAFAFIMNDGDDARVEDAEDRILDALMRY